MPQAQTIDRLAPIAEEQWGLITRRQAEQSGVSEATLKRLTARSVLERVAHGVYRLAGAPVPDHQDLRAAWLQLEPGVPAWERTWDQGVVSHRSAAALYGLGDLPADRHEFTLPLRRQSRRQDVRLHKGQPELWTTIAGLPVTRPSEIASDLLSDREDPGAVAQVIADALRHAYDYPGNFAEALAPHAAAYGLRRGDGLALLRWLIELTDDPDAPHWLEEAQAHLERQRGASAAASAGSVE